MDRRTTLAIALSLFVFALFSALQARYAPPRKPQAHVDSTAVAAPASPAGASAAAPSTGAALVATPASSAAHVAPVVAEKRTVIETPLYHAEFTNRGARLLAFDLKRFGAAYGASRFAEHPMQRPKPGAEYAAGDRVGLGGEPAFGIDMGSGANVHSLAQTMYAVAESLDAAGQVRAVTFTTTDSAGPYVRQTWRVRPDTYVLDLEVETRNVPAAWRITDWSLTTRSWPLVNESSYLTDLRGLRAVSLVGKDLHRDAAGGLVNKAPKLHEGVAHWAGVQSHYFIGAVACVSGDGRAASAGGFERNLDKAALERRPANTRANEPAAEGTLVMGLPASGAGVQRFIAYFGPADFAAIRKVSGGTELERAVDLGFNWLGPISKLLLALLRWLNALVHNYGITILLLATIVRLVLHPLNMSSMKSMRAMQRLAPEMERLKKKYESDPQAQNAAIMALYKENNVNPAGGCLPMFLQMPLFFAMYAVINNVIDLRQAPFALWIHDLSAPDQLFTVMGFPIRVLPLLMAGTGFLSQRFTPTDPKQAPTMYMMNAVMLVIFYNLPSGLVFYWTVMNLLTAIQQWLSLRGDSGATVVVELAKESRGKGRRR